MRKKLFAASWALFALFALEAQSGFRFNRLIDTPYPAHNGTAGGALAVGDVDGDGLKDIVVAGSSGTSAAALIYLQKKGGGFSAALKSADHGIPAMDRGACLKLADMDGDGDLDAVLFGRTGAAAATALFRVYGNSSGRFSVMADLGPELPLEDFADIAGAWGASAQGDNKTDRDVKGLYNGQGWSKGVLELVDLDGDKDLDIVFAGTKGMESGTDPAGQTIQRDWETSGVFLNEGKGGFRYLSRQGWPQAGVPANPEADPERSASGLPKVQRGAGVAADFNRDGKIDIAIFGQANTGAKANTGIPESQRNGMPLAEVCLGNGDGTFHALAGHGLMPLIDCSVTVVDINGDGLADLAALGSTGHPKDAAGGRFLRIWTGKGDGTFGEYGPQVYDRVPNSADCIVPAFNGDLAFADLDGDGDLDLLVGGNTNDKSLYLYGNDGGRFSIVDLDKGKHGIGTNGVSGTGESDAVIDCRIVMEDLDGDGDADIVLNGVGGSMQLLVFQNGRK